MKPSRPLSNRRSPFLKRRLTPGFTRRAFLYGAGTAGVALPFLEGLPERSAFAQGETATFGFFVCTACGVVQAGGGGFGGGDPERFWPEETGALTTAGLAAETDRATGILADYADRLLLVKGINYPRGQGGCGHAEGLVRCLTGKGSSGGNQNATSTGPSADNVIAEALGVASLNLYSGLKGGYIEEKLSFRGAGDVRAAEGNPYNVYKDLTGLSDGTEPDVEPEPGAPSQADILASKRQSVNDLIRGEINSLKTDTSLSAADKTRLELHFDSIRDIEVKLMGMSMSCTDSGLDMAAIDAMNDGSAYRADGTQEEVAKLHMELVALNFACNNTRVAVLQVGDGTDGTRYTIDGEKYERFHHISHRVNSDGSGGSAIAGAVEKHATIDRLRMETMRYALEKWSAYDTPSGPLLDAGFIYWTSHVAQGNHSFDNLPVIVAGSGGGYLKQGAYVDAGGVENGQLLSTLMTANGVPTEDFGGGGGVIAEMLAGA